MLVISYTAESSDTLIDVKLYSTNYKTYRAQVFNVSIYHFSISTFDIYKITELIHKTSKKDAIFIKHLMFYKITKKYAYGHVVNHVLSFFKLRNSHLKITPQQAISMNK